MRLTYRSFLDCGYALLVEAFLRQGSDFISAVDNVNDAINSTPVRDAQPAPAPDPTEHVPTPAENTRALAQLKSMMGNL